MEKAPQFGIVRDIKIIEDGGFFCQACVVGKQKAAISSDPRYCQDCFDVLRELMKTDTRWSHSAWMPKVLVEEDTGGKES